MADRLEEGMAEAADEGMEEVVQEGPPSLLDLFEELSVREYIRKVLDGLKAPKDTGDYKWAKFQLQRSWGLVAAVVVPVASLVLLMVFGVVKPKPPEYEVTIAEEEVVEELEEIEELLEEVVPPEPTEFEVEDVPEVMSDAFESPSPGPATEFSPQPAEFDSVAIVRSPVVMKGILGSRAPGARGSALAGYGGSKATERAVLLALRWLKKYQEYDGHWEMKSGGGPNNYSGAVPAMTGLALLTFLAHGETPVSREFGETVRKGIMWLVENQEPKGNFPRRDNHDYSHPIATYALCEAFAMTKIPMVKYAAEKAVDIILKGQNPSGIWNYNCDGSGRNDTTYSSWCAQALKAALLAGLENEGLKEKAQKSIAGFEGNQSDSGGFGYTGRGATPLTALAVLCIQLHGGANRSSVKKGMQWLEQATFDWENPWGRRPFYYWYYTTQAKFHEGRETWNSWNKQFAPVLVENQVIIPKAIEDLEGNMVDIGYWESPGTTEKYGRVYGTTLCALQLQVYYRYLPTYKTPKDIAADVGVEDEDEDIQIEIL